MFLKNFSEEFELDLRMSSPAHYIEQWLDGDIIGYCEVDFCGDEDINVETIEFEGKFYLAVLRCTVVNVSNLPVRLLRVKQPIKRSEQKAYIGSGHDVIFTIEENVIKDLEEGRSKVCASDNHIWVSPK